MKAIVLGAFIFEALAKNPLMKLEVILNIDGVIFHNLGDLFPPQGVKGRVSIRVRSKLEGNTTIWADDYLFPPKTISDTENERLRDRYVQMMATRLIQDAVMFADNSKKLLAKQFDGR